MRRLAILAFALPLLRAERCDVPPSLVGLKRPGIKQRLAEFPDDFTLNRLLVDSSVYQRKPERHRFAELLSRHPESLDYQYLQARSLVGSNTREALRLYALILANDPDYPWVHLSQLEILRSPAFRDRQKLEASFEAFTRVCPSSFAAYRWLGDIPDLAETARAAVRLRAMLKDARGDGDLIRYRALWSAEFKVRPKAEEDEEKRLIREDLNRLLTMESSPAIRGVIESGAALVGDDQLQKRMAAERPPEFWAEYNAWRKAHPYVGNGAPVEKKRAYAQARLAESAKLREIAPDNYSGYSEKLEALVGLDAPDGEILRAAEEFLAVFRKDEWSSSNMDTVVPRAFVERGIYLDRVPALVEDLVTRLGNPETVISIDLDPSPLEASQRMGSVANIVDALQTMVKAYQKMGQSEKAHETIRRMDQLLTSKRPALGEKDSQVLNWYRNAQFSFWQCTGELAEQEGRKLDAFSAYQQELTYMPGNFTILERERKLWRELGGSDEAWTRWVAAIPNSPLIKPDYKADTTVHRPLPAMSVKDMDGNLWTLDRLKGKITVATIWATWCAPCVAELPYFAKLARQLEGRDDALAISFNTDDNIALAESFLKKHEYSFPALSAKQYAEDLMPYFSIPRTWIIKNGIIVAEWSGFGADGDKWVEQMLGLLK